MQESQWVGLLAVAAGVFSIMASACDWEWFMNSRKARAWVKRIGRTNARLLYGGIGVFVCLFGLFMFFKAPGESSATARTENPTPQTSSQTGPPANQESKAPQNRTPSIGTPSSLDSTAIVVSEVNPPQVAATTQPGSVTSTPPLTPPATPAKPETVPPAEGIDLLKRIDLQRDQLQGTWVIQDGALVSSKDRPANLKIPVDVPQSYQMTAIIEMVDGNELASLGLVVDGHGVVALLAGSGGNNCGLQFIDGKTARQNETSYRGSVLRSGQNEIVCTVNENHVHVQCNGQKVIEWRGDPKRLSNGTESKPGQPVTLLVGSWNTSCRFSRLALIPQ